MPPEDFSNAHRAPEHPEEELAAFALNALDGVEYREVAQHVVQCLHCQEVLVGFQETAASLAGGAPEVELPKNLKSRVLAAATRPGSADTETGRSTSRSLPPADARWSPRRLRRWLAPTSIAALSILLAGAIGMIVAQDRELDQLTAATQVVSETAAAAAPAGSQIADLRQTEDAGVTAGIASGADTLSGVQFEEPAARRESNYAANNTILDRLGLGITAESARGNMPAESERVDLVQQDMEDVMEATMLAMQPETEKLPMTSPMGTEPEAKGVLIVDESGQHAVLMVSGMPADSYQVWLVRADKQTLVDRIVVNVDDGNSVKSLELDESVYEFREVALMPDERHGPSTPNGEKFLSARIINGPPTPAGVNGLSAGWER